MEVLVSIVVIAVVLASLFRMQSGYIDLAAAGRFQSTAPLLARKQLAMIEKNLKDMESSQGEFDSPFHHFTWSCAIYEQDVNGLSDLPENDGGKLKKIQLEIRHTDSGRLFKIEAFRSHCER